MDFTSLIQALFPRRATASAVQAKEDPVDLELLESILPAVVDCIRCYA